jgi:nitrate/TMAO reductase-like tetraheme cytochrome c subunit
MNRRPDFVSPTGLVVALVVIFGVLLWTLVEGPVLFSSGPLNSAAQGKPLGGVKSHAQLTNDCGSCHPAPWSSKSMADSCLDCHTGVAGQIRAEEGLHGRLLGRLSSPTCRGCHPEHNGPDGALTVLDRDAFDHDLTGYSLRTHVRTAQGDRFTCKDCHTEDLMKFDQVVCAECHATIDAAFMERHAATYGKDCLPCHDGSGRDGADYAHDTGPFKLTGEHAEVACVDCHRDARSQADLKQTPQDCFSCHAEDDAHDGAYGRQCEDCHTAASWGDATFDHSVFPLDHGSEERRATCETCHPDGTDSYTCYGCHAHAQAKVLDQHEGRTLAELNDCASCHPGGGEADEGGD